MTFSTNSPSTYFKNNTYVLGGLETDIFNWFILADRESIDSE